MTRLVVPPGKAYRLINHGPCPLVTTGDGARKNVAPINWTVPIQDDPPLVLCAMGKGSLTEELLGRTGEWALNIMSETFAAVLLACGKSSGRGGDKFLSSGLTPVPCKKIRPPRLAESLAHLELKMKKAHDYGDVVLYVGRVLHAEVEPEVWEKGFLVPEKARTLHHLGSGRFAVADKLVAP
jgi:flavin reductase (DIM6/NTAB) family NADH-FMN oxidoreductase RutF